MYGRTVESVELGDSWCWCIELSWPELSIVLSNWSTVVVWKLVPYSMSPFSGRLCDCKLQETKGNSAIYDSNWLAMATVLGPLLRKKQRWPWFEPLQGSGLFPGGTIWSMVGLNTSEFPVRERFMFEEDQLSILEGLGCDCSTGEDSVCMGWLDDMIEATWTKLEPQALTRSMRVDEINSEVDSYVVRLRGLIQSRRGGRNLGNQIPSRLSKELWLLLDSQSLTGTPDGVPTDLLLPYGRFKWDYGRLLVQYRRSGMLDPSLSITTILTIVQPEVHCGITHTAWSMLCISVLKLLIA